MTRKSLYSARSLDKRNLSAFRGFRWAQSTMIQSMKSNALSGTLNQGKREYPEKNLSEQSREPTNSVHLWHRVRESGTRDTLMEGERSHHYANPAPHFNLDNSNSNAKNIMSLGKPQSVSPALKQLTSWMGLSGFGNIYCYAWNSLP